MGRTVTLKALRGQVTASDFSERTIVTMHPSAILRSPDDESRHKNYADFVADLRMAKEAME
jgi:DNA polymerase